MTFCGRSVQECNFILLFIMYKSCIHVYRDTHRLRIAGYAVNHDNIIYIIYIILNAYIMYIQLPKQYYGLDGKTILYKNVCNKIYLIVQILFKYFTIIYNLQ